MSSDERKPMRDIEIVIEADDSAFAAAMKRIGEQIRKDDEHTTAIIPHMPPRKVFTIGDGATRFAEPGQGDGMPLPHENPQTIFEAMENFSCACANLGNALLDALQPLMDSMPRYDPVAEARARSREDLAAKRKAMRRGKGRL